MSYSPSKQTAGIREMGRWDVAVCGGGPAGVAAAAEAARAGASTILIERWPFMGGLGTAAHVNGIHTSDGEKQVIFGFCAEFVERADRHGACWHMPEWPHDHLQLWFDSEVAKIVYDEIARDAGFTPLLYTPAVDIESYGDIIHSVIVGSPRGLRSIVAQVFIDATGDADLPAWAGCPTAVGREKDGKVQGMTLMCRLSGINDRIAWALTPRELDEIKRDMEAARDRGELPPFGLLALRAYGKKQFNPNMCPVTADPLDNLSMSDATIEARLRMMKFVKYWRKRVPGYQDCDIAAVGALGVRESRRIKGDFVFSGEDVRRAAKFTDAIGHGFWMIDIHDPLGSGSTTWTDRNAWLPPGESYHIPYRAMLPSGVENLFAVGRCASATHEGIAALRVQSHCMVMGQAAGMAAVMAIESNRALQKIDVRLLQKRLVNKGVYLADLPET